MNMSKQALQLIQDAKINRSTYLDLGNCGLTELPNELFELEWLEELFLCIEKRNYSLEKNKWIWFRTQNKGEKNNFKNLLSQSKHLKKSWFSNLFSKEKNSQLHQLKNLKNLKKLWINGEYSSGEWELRDLSPLKDLNQLQILHISSTEIIDLSPLEGLTQLHCFRSCLRPAAASRTC